MKNIKFVLIILLLFAKCVSTKLPAQEVSIDYFYDQLSPYGHWVEMTPYGWVWQPFNTAPDWRPYSDGYWVYTNEGWLYNANTQWSWAVYHYGRWFYDDFYGWVWVPGTVWAPAWVAWRHGGRYIGWAPLPPEVAWRDNYGFRESRFDWDGGIHWSCWTFVEHEHFVDRDVYRRCEIPARNVTIIHETNNITNYNIVNNRVINNSISVNDAEKYSRRKVEVHNIVESNSYNNNNRRVNNNQVQVYRPAISTNRTAKAPVNVVTNKDIESKDALLRQHLQEKKKVDNVFNKRTTELHDIQRKENNNTNVSKDELQKQHNEQINALKQHHDMTQKVIENKHQRELNNLNQGNKNNNRNSNNSNNNRNKNNHRKDDKKGKDKN